MGNKKKKSKQKEKLKKSTGKEPEIKPSIFQSIKNVFSGRRKKDSKDKENEIREKVNSYSQENKNKIQMDNQNIDAVKTEIFKSDDEKWKKDDEKLFNVSEIFYSIQGESTLAGLPCVFIRFQGCNIRCTWCDTGYALNVKKEKQLLSAEQIIGKIKKYDCKYVCITGGEPLMQKNVPDLMTLLCNDGYTVSLETNGYYSLKDIDRRVIKIVDIKCPGSKMQKKNNFDNIEYLTKFDEVKFVIKDKEDFIWVKETIKKYKLNDKVNAILMSPVFGKLEPKQLSKWIIKDDLKTRVQIQLHKYIWNPKKRRV